MWRNLIQSHKAFRDNKNKSGQKRKTFRYYEQIERIVGKQHDISPPCTSGSSMTTCTNNKPKYRFTAHPSSAVDENYNTQESSEDSSPPMQSEPDGTPKGKRRPKESSDDKILKCLKEMEEVRRREHEERERMRETKSAMNF